MRALAATLVLLAAACSTGAESAATVLVDYSHDEFNTQFIKYFPDEVKVHPGDRITFRQHWTGEPHTVTLGTLVQEMIDVTVPLFAEYGHLPLEEVPQEALQSYFEAECALPGVWPNDLCGDDPESDALGQAAAQPCLVESGTPPDDGSPCEVQELPPFTGRETYYNSGIIPYEGPGENLFDLRLSDDIEPGQYAFYCAVHGSMQAGTIEVVPEDEPVPDAADVSVATRAELNEIVQPFREVFAEAQEGKVVLGGEPYNGRFAGLLLEDVDAMLNEFIPKELETKVDEPVTWFMFGPHSISFDVPEYFPIVEFLDDGTVAYNEDVDPPAGGAPAPPEDHDPGEPLVMDGGTYDGSDFWSSGVLFSQAHVEYTLRFSTPGTYQYACLIHPPMVGTVRVTG